MAVIKPLTNCYQNRALDFSDLSTKTLYNVTEEDESDLIGYNPPVSPPMMPYGQIPACGGLMRTAEEAELYTPQHLRPDCIIPQRVAAADHLREEVAVGRFNGYNPERNVVRAPEAASGGMPVYRQAHLIQQDLDPFDEEPTSPLEEEETERERFGLLRGYIYNNAQFHHEEDSVEVKLASQGSLASEGSLALMPPSPFRDCAAPPASPFPNSPLSESILCSPTHVAYAAAILRDYKQSSSTL
ncbi:Metabotropic glutamate receptor 1 [Liparis tanakae]|uniref:Metabotropic glutamate receptor 1 n=1 Tax=Liparis tanakae TaxID=230148 RepID=A0A4Z2IKI2_9TELE|nr:Metabotropic glutamate receptor 1 [Liparis tanakae]